MAVRGRTPSDLQQLLRLSYTLHTSGDAVTRKKKLLAFVRELLKADGSASVVAHVEQIPRRHTIVSLVHDGSRRVDGEQLLLSYLPRLHAMPVSANDVPSKWRRINGAAGPPRHQVSDALWRPMPLSDSRILACLGLVRDGKSPARFVARERMLLHLIHSEMSWIYEADLHLASRGADSLSPRQRQTLRYLLAGNSEKQIAEMMGISQHTVHHHVKALYRHFHVCSRSELLARWLQ